jgi:nitrogen fixation NifU-like protein
MGMMAGGMDELYREVILDHHRNPRGTGPLSRGADAAAEGKNPSCGDELELELACDADTIAEASVRCRGCAIATASASILAELVPGRSAAGARELAEAFRQVMHSEDGELADALDPGDLEVLTGVRKFPVRIKCALLPWITLLEALDARDQGRTAAASTTEV